MTHNKPTLPYFMKTKEAAKLIGKSPSTLKAWRNQSKCLIEGVHYIKENARSVLYNVQLLLDFMVNIDDPETHNKRIQKFLKERDKGSYTYG
jgi:2-phosphoglycerate kinase